MLCLLGSKVGGGGGEQEVGGRGVFRDAGVNRGEKVIGIRRCEETERWENSK